jgi:hypothetical protein
MARNALSAGLSMMELERLLRTRQRELDALFRRRKRLERKLGAIDEDLARLGGDGRGRRRGGAAGSRARNDVSLPEAIAKVLGKARAAMSVGDIVDGVSRGGYRSTSANFRAVVNQALVKDKRFMAQSRGMYALKG